MSNKLMPPLFQFLGKLVFQFFVAREGVQPGRARILDRIAAVAE